MTFKNLVPGQMVTYRAYAGYGLKGPEFVEKRGRVCRLLCFETHVVLNVGGRSGLPQVVDSGNFVKAGRIPKKSG